jgi:ABC-type Fe3+/spermidine/putrescine transport system ATPase subunit
VADPFIIETADLWKTYGGVEALRGLDLQVPVGSIFGLLGRNGAGKTTTIKILLGMVRPTSGRVRVLGLAADAEPASVEIRRRTGFASEDKDLYDYMTVGEMMVGRTLTLVVNATTGGGTFHGLLDEDGRSITGDVTIAQRSAAIPFHLNRTGDAKIAPPPKSAPIAKRLEGSWTGALTVEGKQLPVVITMANQPDGTATGTIATDGLQLPIAMTQKASNLRIEGPSVSGSYAGVLNDAGTELVGTWTQKTLTLPLTLRHNAR